MNARLRHPGPAAEVAEAARTLGRPLGSIEPKTLWLRDVIREMRRTGHGCTDTFRRLSLIEDVGPEPRSFSVSAETADAIWEEIGGDIRGEPVTWESFRSAWRRTGGSF